GAGEKSASEPQLTAPPIINHNGHDRGATAFYQRPQGFRPLRRSRWERLRHWRAKPGNQRHREGNGQNESGDLPSTMPQAPNRRSNRRGEGNFGNRIETGAAGPAKPVSLPGSGNAALSAELRGYPRAHDT